MMKARLIYGLEGRMRTMQRLAFACTPHLQAAGKLPGGWDRARQLILRKPQLLQGRGQAQIGRNGALYLVVCEDKHLDCGRELPRRDGALQSSAADYSAAHCKGKVLHSHILVYIA
jgi:hypothetical protein